MGKLPLRPPRVGLLAHGALDESDERQYHGAESSITCEEGSVAGSGKAVWVGRIISVLVALLFVFSSAMKLMGVAAVKEGMAHLGLREAMLVPLAVIELACAVIYLVPATAVLGAILLTGFIGGTIVTHWRMAEPVYIQIALGLLVWLGLYLREERLKALIPVRRQ